MSTAKNTKTYLPHYTIADYSRWEGDWELWQGIPVATTPSPFGPHQLASVRLARQIGNQLEKCACGCEVLHEIDWVISEDMVVRPDLVVVCDGVPEHHLERPPQLIAEILSPSTEQKDRTAKFELYQSQRVQFYLLVNVQSQKLEAFALDTNGKYQPIPTDKSFDLVLTSNCRIQINPAAIF